MLYYNCAMSVYTVRLWLTGSKAMFYSFSYSLTDDAFPCLSLLSHCTCLPVIHAKSLQLCPTFCDTMNCSLLGFYVYRILQARILEWVAMPSSSFCESWLLRACSYLSPENCVWLKETQKCLWAVHSSNNWMIQRYKSPVLWLEVGQISGVIHTPELSWRSGWN